MTDRDLFSPYVHYDLLFAEVTRAQSKETKGMARSNLYEAIHMASAIPPWASLVSRPNSNSEAK